MKQLPSTSRSRRRVRPQAPPRDGSEVQRLERLLAEAGQQRDRAEAADRAKDEFIAMLDHELRNPLGAIASAVRLLQLERAGAERSRDALDVIARQGDRLGQLLADLRDAAQAVSGEGMLARHPMDLARSAERAANALRLDSAMRHHELALRLQPAWIDGDPLRIEQVVSQSLMAALHRIPAGRRVLLQVLGSDGEALLRISDDGHGPAPAPEPAPMRPSLGSALAQRLIALHGGSTRIGTGFFELRLPAIAAPPAAAEGACAASAKACRVVLVQPAGEAASALQSLLAVDGHHVSRHDDAQAGLEAVLAHRPEVTVVDLALPGLGAFALARRSRGAGHAGLMIAVSSDRLAADAQRAMHSGFDAHLLQPVDAALLRELMLQRG